MTIPVEQAAINLAVALGLSAAIGFERQWRNRLAGLRTNTLVALGAATFVIFATLVPGDASPTRVAAQVVSGIGLLGAGLIFREGLSVRGLNTSATLWCSAAIGVLAGRAGQTRHHPGGCADVPPGLGDPVRRHLSDRQGPPPTCPGFGMPNPKSPITPGWAISGRAPMRCMNWSSTVPTRPRSTRTSGRRPTPP
jgi:hypothetical protein